MQRIRFTSLGPPGGHWRLRHEGVSTAPIEVDASADEVRAALEAALFTDLWKSQKRSIVLATSSSVTFVADPGTFLHWNVKSHRGYNRSTPYCQVDEVVPATSVVSGGAFRLLFEGKLTEPLSSHCFIVAGPASSGEAPFHRSGERLRRSFGSGPSLVGKTRARRLERPRRPGVAR